MKTSSERFLIAAVALAAILAVAAVGFQMVTDRNRNAAVAKLTTSPVIERYRKAHSAESNKTPPTESSTPRTSSETPVLSTTPSESIAAFAAVFSRAQALRGSKRWNEIDDSLSNKPLKEWTEEDLAQLKAVLDESHGFIREIRRLAEMGGPAYELDFSKGPAMELPHLAKLRELTRLLRFDAIVQARQGDYGEAVEDILAGMKLAVGTLADEPILISQLVRIAMDGLMCQAVQEALPPEGLSPDLARGLVEYAGRIDCRDGFADSFSGEGLCGLGAFDEMRKGSPDTAGTPPTQAFLTQLYASAFARPWLNMDEETFAGKIARIGDASRLPYYEAKPLLGQIEREIGDLPRTRVLSYQLLPALTRAAEAQARNEAQLDLLQIGLSIEQYHARNGTYPTTLDAIASDVGGRVPVDPFTGQPYVYKPSGGSFLLYSVGSNAVDDGGKYDYITGDLVWRGVLESNK
jgi:Tfp pilus assembly protein PilE